jgi:LmbE family N-acetylglucosaminyl deacetylase
MKNLCLYVLLSLTSAFAQMTPSVIGPDDRYKADILLVVAHPDDEGAVSPYLARALDEGRRIAVVYGTRGGSGSNQAGREHAAALADIREIEARRAWTSLGVSNVWFLSGKDSATQNVLKSLGNWGHGQTLEEMVRIIRLTRPEVVLTFFPGVFIGENHGDHQAAGVIATEAFDLAINVAIFPSQVAGQTQRLEPYLENLRPWQPKKLYYFGFGNHAEFRDQGPTYSVRGISSSKHVPYWRVALDAFGFHETQEKAYLDSLASMNTEELEKLATNPSGGWASDVHFVFAKSVVGGAARGDIFEQIDGPLVEAGQSQKDEGGITIELGGPWSFYRDFRSFHHLEQVPDVEVPEIAVMGGTTLQIPLWVINSSKTTREVALLVEAPQGWTMKSRTEQYSVSANSSLAATVELALPPLPEGQPSQQSLEVHITGLSKENRTKTLRLKIQTRVHALPE